MSNLADVIIRTLQLMMTPPVEPGVGDNLLERAATTRRVGVPGFESPGEGEGMAQRKLSNCDKIVFSDEGIPYYVTYKWLNEICTQDEETKIVNNFYENIWRKYEDKYESIWLDNPFIVALMSGYFGKLVPAETRRNKRIREISNNPSIKKYSTASRFLCALTVLEKIDPDFVRGIIKEISSQDLERILSAIGVTEQTIYTYNYPDDCALTQDIQFTAIGDWVGIIFHTGVDARCGFEGPVFVKCGRDIYDCAPRVISISCPKGREEYYASILESFIASKKIHADIDIADGNLIVTVGQHYYFFDLLGEDSPIKATVSEQAGYYYKKCDYSFKQL